MFAPESDLGPGVSWGQEGWDQERLASAELGSAELGLSLLRSCPDWSLFVPCSIGKAAAPAVGAGLVPE